MTIFQRLESFAIFVLAVMAAIGFDIGWWKFILIFLIPDLSIAGYCFGNRAGAIIYNTFHSYFVPVAILIISMRMSSTLGTAAAFIWFAHIGFDRTLGLGLKYPTGFRDTHLGRIGGKI